MNGRHVCLFGLPRVECEAGAVPRFRSQRTVALLGYLVAEQRALAREALSGLFWPDEPATKGRANLRRELHNLNQILPDCWETDRLSVQFAPASTTTVDLFDFVQLEQAAQWTKAAALVGGPFLEGLYLDDNPEFESWLLGERERWRQRAEQVLTHTIDEFTQQANYAAALDSAQQLLQLAPWHEDTHRQVIQLLAWTDQRAAALRQYQLCVDILDSELGVPPEPETTRLFEDIREGKTVPPPTALTALSPPRHNLPAQTTPFIGREVELADIGQLLNEPAVRLITIFGPGGMGKTRLALAAAQQYIATNQQRVGFVDLAPLASGDDIIPAIAEAVGYPFQQDGRSPKQQLLDYVRTRQLLLLLDNFEHLLEQVGLIHELLQAGSQVNVLVTSRERLQLSGETVFTLAGMAFPALETVADAHNYHAVQLFLQGTKRIRPDLTLGVDDLAATTRICRLVQGMPLAILLAAAWVDLLSPPEIAEEIEKSLDFLATDLHDVPDRQRSIQAVFEHSWRRLTESERTFFMKLAIFRGGFTREAAQEIAGASLTLLSSLVNKALLQRQRDGRYTLHELLRQYAEAKLVAASQIAAVRADHATYYSNFLHQREADIKGRRQLAALDEIEADFENIRTAWQWAARQRNYEVIGQALESLIWFCFMRGRFQESRELMRLAQEQLAPGSGQEPKPVWGCVMAGTLRPLLTYLETSTETRRQLEIALTIAQAHNNQANSAFCLWRLGTIVYGESRLEEARAYYDQSLAYYRSVDDDFYASYLLKDMALLHIRRGQIAKGIPLLQESSDLRRKLGDQTGLAASLEALGWLAYYGAHYRDAESQWHEGYQLSRRIGDHRLTAWILSGLGWMTLLNKGDLTAAQKMAAEMQSIALELSDYDCQRRAQVIFGILAGVDEDYQTCQQIFPHSAELHRFPANRIWDLIGNCLAACGLNDPNSAKQHLYEVLKVSHTFSWIANYAIALPFAAILVDNTGQPERATELLGLAYHHPLSPKGWLHCWPLLARLKTDLKSGLGPDTFESAWARGTALDLEATAEMLLAELRR